MKIKQIKLLILAFSLIISSISGAVMLGGSTPVKAYVCSDPAHPTDVYEYHESDGKCWKVRYTDRNQDPPIATCTGSTCVCPNGGGFQPNGACTQQCTGGDVYHADTNSCWYKNGYTEQDTQKIAPTNNDGTPIASDNAACSDGFYYMKDGIGSGGPGCYDRASNGTFPCGPNQEVQVQGSRAGTSESCGDANKNRLIPKDTKQSSDKTNCQTGYAKDNNVCKPYSDFTNKESCTAHGGNFVLTDTKNPSNGSDDVWTCQAPLADNDPCKGMTGDQLKACQGGQRGEDCSKQATEELKNACNKGKAQSGTDGTGKNCGEAETVLVTCKGEGVQAIGDVLRIIITVLSILIGVAAVGGLAWASILYAKAQDNAGNVSEARELIRNIVIGLLLYGFLVAIVNWLVPGGVIG